MTRERRDCRDCRCPRARHQHGTYGGYARDGCRCPDCTAAATRAKKQSECRRLTAEREGLPSGLVHACGTQRRLRALAAIGWSCIRLAGRLNVSPQRVHAMRSGATDSHAALAARVARLYDELWNVYPTWDGAERARCAAARRGWHPPLAWDDETIDDPDAQPWTDSGDSDSGELDEIAVARIMAGTLTIPAGTHSPERIEAIRRLHDRKLTDSEIGRRLEMTKDAVHRARKYHGIGREAAA